jgi:peptidoglycan hydrolase CwlO-like protein
MPNGNAKVKTTTVVLSAMATLIMMGIVAVFGMSVATGRNQTTHESSAASHPVIQNKVDNVAQDVEVIGEKVDNLMLMQREQTIILEQIGDDIGELKEAAP